MADPPTEEGDVPDQVATGGDEAAHEQQRHARAGDVAEPERLLCPITHIMYRDPCFVPESGNTYERLAVERYWSSTPRPRDPLTNMDLRSQVLHPNWGVRRDVQRFLEENPSYTPQGWPDRDVPLPTESSARQGAGTSGGASWAFLSQRRRWLFLAGALATVLLSILCNRLSGVGAGAGGAAAAARQAGGGNVTILHPPKGSRLEAWKTSEQLSVYVPPRGFDMDLAGQLFFACFWTGFTALWTLGAVQNGAPVLFAMFSLPFWGVGLSLLVSLAKAPFQSEQMDLGLADYRFSKDWFGFVVSNVAGPIADLLEPPLRQVDGEHCELIFKAGLQEISFGTALHKVEAAWVQERVKQHLIGTEDGNRFNVQVPDRTAEAGQLPYGQHRVQSGGFHFGVYVR